jgi:hypothetical protein
LPSPRPKWKQQQTTALAAEPPTAGKQGSLKKLLLGPDAKTWNYGLSNEWGRILPFGIGRNRPIEKRIKGTGTVFFIKVPSAKRARRHLRQLCL